MASTAQHSSRSTHIIAGCSFSRRVRGLGPHPKVAKIADQVSGGLLSPFLQRARVRAAGTELHGTVLDIGCGNGALAGYVSPKRYLGLDINEDSIQCARNRCPDHQFVLANKSELFTHVHSVFDTIVMLAVIEHTDVPVSLLSNVRQHLCDKGHVILTTPHSAFGWAHSLGARIGILSREAHDEPEVLFNVQTMTDVAANAGFSLVKYRRFLAGANQLFVLSRGVDPSGPTS